MNIGNLDRRNAKGLMTDRRKMSVRIEVRGQIMRSRNMVTCLFGGLLLLVAAMAGQQVAAGPWNNPDPGFQAQAGAIASVEPVPRKGNEPLDRNNGANDPGSIFYQVEYYLLPQVASRGDVFLGGAYKNSGEGFGGYVPSKISSSQQPVTRGSGLVLIRRNTTDPAVSDQVVFWLIQDGKQLVERSFPFNVATQLSPTLKLPDSGVVPGGSMPQPIRRP
jgi:hypothetical protein